MERAACDPKRTRERSTARDSELYVLLCPAAGLRLPELELEGGEPEIFVVRVRRKHQLRSAGKWLGDHDGGGATPPDIVNKLIL